MDNININVKAAEAKATATALAKEVEEHYFAPASKIFAAVQAAEEAGMLPEYFLFERTAGGKTAGGFILSCGSYRDYWGMKYPRLRTVASELNIPSETELKYREEHSLMRGTGYRKAYYEVVGNNNGDAVVVNYGGSASNVFIVTAHYERGYFLRKKEYAQRVGRLSRLYQLPFDVALALGDNSEVYKHFKKACEIERLKGMLVDDELASDLGSGIGRRKGALHLILGEALYDEIGIDGMGQEYSSRLARYIWSRVCS